MVDFIRMDLIELLGSRVKRELQNETFLLIVRFEPNIFRL